MPQLVSVILPAWNAEKTLEATLRSVLTQTHRELRVLAVDDGSTDDTPEILKRLSAEDPRLLPIYAPNGGPAAARNLALSQLPAGTDFIMFLAQQNPWSRVLFSVH